MIRLAHIDITEYQKQLVMNLLTEGTIGQSPIIAEFEENFAAWVGSKYAVAVSSGTMADTIALSVLKFCYPGKNEVILPALTFAAHLNSVLYNGLTPVFVDIGSDLQIDLAKAVSKVNQNTLCLFPVHLLGRPVDTNALRLMSIPYIEDACEALGSEHSTPEGFWKKCGTFGTFGTYSFFPSHSITTGEGGMIATDNEEYAMLARKFRNHGRSSQEFHFDVIGYNGKMTSIEAALGLGALSFIDDVVMARRTNFKMFGGIEKPDERVCAHAYPIICENNEKRNRLLKVLRDNNIECRNLFSSLPTQEIAYRRLEYREGDFPLAEEIGKVGLYVPCHQGLTNEDIFKIKGLINEKETQETQVLT